MKWTKQKNKPCVHILMVIYGGAVIETYIKNKMKRRVLMVLTSRGAWIYVHLMKIFMVDQYTQME